MLAMPLRILRICCEWKTNAKHGFVICIIHIAGVSLWLISARPCPSSWFSFKVRLIFHIPLNSAEMPIRMQENLYKLLTINNKRLTIATNVLPPIILAYNCSRICCKYAFLTNFRRMFLILPRPWDAYEQPKNAYEQLQMSCDHCELAPNSIRKPIRKHIRQGVRAASVGHTHLHLQLQ